MELAELYDALGKVEQGDEMIATLKAELSKRNGENAKYRKESTSKDAQIEELKAQVEALKGEGTGAKTTIEKLQLQVDEINKKYEAAEKAKREEQQKRMKADILQQTVTALENGHATKPSEIAKILIQSVHADEEGRYIFTADDNEAMSIADGTAKWLKDNTWAVKDLQTSGSGISANGGKASITKEQFNQMTYAEKAKLYDEDIDTYNELTKQ